MNQISIVNEEDMEIRYTASPEEIRHYTTEQLRQAFLVENLMQYGKVRLVYTHYDRMIIGGVVPVDKALALPASPALGADHFLERRELGVINVGGTGAVTVDGEHFVLNKKDGLYIGRGSKSVQFTSENAAQPARFYVASAPAHRECPAARYRHSGEDGMTLGSREASSERTIYKVIHQEGIDSCQLVMGFTELAPGCVWNTMPCHTHDRRMEVYFYFDLPAEARIVHLMGEPQQTRHLVVKNEEAVISPPWSIHAGVGTHAYAFIWAMAGENKDYTDMDLVAMEELQ